MGIADYLARRKAAAVTPVTSPPAPEVTAQTQYSCGLHPCYPRYPDISHHAKQHAANDPAPARPLQPRPAVLRLPQRHGDPGEEALLLLDWLHSLGVLLTAEHGALAAHGLDTLPEPLREEVQILLLPEVQGRDLLAAVRARDAATAAIERAMPMQRCWGCAHLSTRDAHREHAPQCQRGHALAWRRTGPGGVRTVPPRVDRRGPCAEFTPR